MEIAQPERETPITTQRLAGVIKSARDVMRKDKGLSGELDRLPMLTWLMFLKFIDDMERVAEAEAELKGRPYSAVLQPPYRWRDWVRTYPMTGDDLIDFVGQDEAIGPLGKRGPGLFTYLRSLEGPGSRRDRRDVIAGVFRRLGNQMQNGYLLRDVIDKVDTLHFDSSQELHALGQLYESLLREMRDAAGDSGEFYTPRPLVKLIVKCLDPQIGQTVLDPAAGTGGFLVESFLHLAEQVDRTEDWEWLQVNAIQGVEAKPLPYLFCEMNLLLHGIEAPNIDPGNALRTPLREIGERDRVDVIATNPPFGGEEEAGIRRNFPSGLQTAETALLFIQLVMRRLRRGSNPGRAGVVVPNGTLYSSGVGQRIRQTLLQNFNLHTILRLPKGVFEPYADIPTNVLFFDAGKPTREVWFYEHPLPPDRAKLRSPSYSQSRPLEFSEFEPFLDWWDNRSETSQAWRLSVEELERADFNLDQRNPARIVRDHLRLSQLRVQAESQSRALAAGLEEVKAGLSSLDEVLETRREVSLQSTLLGEACEVLKGKFPTKKTPPGKYPFVVTAAERRSAPEYQFDAPAVCVPMVSSTGHGHASIHRLHYQEGKFALANIMAALLVRPETPLLPRFLFHYLTFHKEEKLVSLMAGTANTSLTLTKLKGVQIEFPEIDVQREITDALDLVSASLRTIKQGCREVEEFERKSMAASLHAAFSN